MPPAYDNFLVLSFLRRKVNIGVDINRGPWAPSDIDLLTHAERVLNDLCFLGFIHGPKSWNYFKSIPYKLWEYFGVFFPTCQVMVCRFYQSCFPPSPPSPSPPAASDLNCELRISVGTAGSTASSRCQWRSQYALPTASSRCQLALQDLHREHQVSVQWALPDRNRGCQMSDRMPQRMPDRMSKYTSNKMPDRVSEYIYQTKRQTHCQMECQIIYIYIHTGVYARKKAR